MSKLKTTWQIFDRVEGANIGFRAIVTANGDIICNPSPMGECNARLIAAAPDLLAALEMVSGIWSHDQTANVSPHSPLGIVRAAIAKATGETL
ncbi:MAG: hypothetical protein ACO3X1_14035 [Burkholderiaceae bacterium]